MLYLFYGSDTQKARAKVRSTITSLLKREPDAAYVRLDAETFTTDALREHVVVKGLFAKRVLVVFDHVFENTSVKEAVLARLKDIGASENVFILLEGALDKKLSTKLEKQAERTQIFNLKKAFIAKSDFNIFSLTDALGNRDKKKLWVQYQRALRAGSAPEELHGILFWQTKTMLLVEQKSTEGLKPFVVMKAKRFLSNWTLEELKQLSTDLVDVYHNARRGKFEFNIGLEKLILSV